MNIPHGAARWWNTRMPPHARVAPNGNSAAPAKTRTGIRHTMAPASRIPATLRTKSVAAHHGSADAVGIRRHTRRTKRPPIAVAMLPAMRSATVPTWWSRATAFQISGCNSAWHWGQPLLQRETDPENFAGSELRRATTKEDHPRPSSLRAARARRAVDDRRRCRAHANRFVGAGDGPPKEGAAGDRPVIGARRAAR
jgi:hypothetical protein